MRRSILPALIVIACALLVRVMYALSKSFVLDEFHSYYHATHSPMGAFLGDLGRDNHPPLSFLVIGAAAEALGRAEIALRSPAILFSVLEIALVFRLARRLGATSRWAAGAAALLAASAMHFDYGSQARMYALLALLVTISVSALVDLVGQETPKRGSAVALALGAAGALYTHYFAVQYLAVIVAAASVGLAITGEGRRIRRLAAPLVAAAVLFAPWALTGFRTQLGHKLPPGGDDLGLSELAQSMMHLFAHNVSLAGPAGRWVFIAGAAIPLGLSALGLLRLLAARETRIAGGIVGAAAFLVPVVSWAAANIAPRAGFTWHYVLPSAAAAATLCAFGLQGRIGAAAIAVSTALGTALIGLHLANPATEDFRGAVHHALKSASDAPSGDIVRLVSVEWQPALFPQGQPYDYYAPRVGLQEQLPVPARAPMIPGGFMVKNFGELSAADRVIVIRRSLPDGQPLLKKLGAAFPHRTVTPFGYGVDVIEFRR